MEHDDRRVVVMRKVAATIRYSVWERVIGTLREAGWLSWCKINKSDREITLPNGSRFVFVGADDPEKLKSIEAVTDYWLEEATEFAESDLDVIDAGLSANVSPTPQIYMTFNPIPILVGTTHWLQKRFLPVMPELGDPWATEDTMVLRTNYEANLWCPPQIVRLIEGYKTTNPELYKMWGLGLFTRVKGTILKSWDRVYEVPERAPFMGYGLDFGFALDPATVVAVWLWEPDIWIEEKIYQTELTNPELHDQMIEIGLQPGLSDIAADSAEPKSIRELKDKGWLIHGFTKTPDYKRAAAMWMSGLKVHVVHPSPNVENECATWSWKPAVQKAGIEGDENRKFLPRPKDGNDHGIDATIYRAYHRQEDVLRRNMIRRAHSEEVASINTGSVGTETIKGF
jgi:phage terminase large subunit